MGHAASTHGKIPHRTLQTQVQTKRHISLLIQLALLHRIGQGGMSRDAMSRGQVSSGATSRGATSRGR